MKKIFLITIFAINTLSLQGFATRLQTSLLGNEDASSELVAMCNEACKAHGIAPCQVKYLNPVIGKSLVKSMVTSLPGLGNIMWIDKDAYANASQEEKEFTIYHETVHIMRKHPLLNCGICGWAALAAVVVPYVTFEDSKELSYSPHLLFVGMLAIGGACFSYVTKDNEKKADIQAAKALLAQGKENVVQAKLAQLKKAYSKHGNTKSFLYPSLEKQIESLEPFAA